MAVNYLSKKFYNIGPRWAEFNRKQFNFQPSPKNKFKKFHFLDALTIGAMVWAPMGVTS
jgi:hypothetical protein